MNGRGQSPINRIQLYFERLFLRGLRYRLLFAALIVLFVALLGGVLMHLFAPGFSDLPESIWWAFLRLTDPGYLGDDEGLFGRSVATIVTVLGYLLFLGLLIAFLTQWMNEVIHRMESGERPLSIEGHVLVLGWTHRTPDIVLNLLRTRDRTQRFLKVRNLSTLRVVVLAEQVDRQRLEALEQHLDDYYDDGKVLLRSGSPLRLEHLQRVCFEDAAAIVLPGEDFSDRSPGAADAETLKTLLSISRHTAADDNRPLAVAALYNPNRAAIAHQAYRGETEILASDQVVCRLIAQSVRQKGIWRVFAELTSIHVGNAFFLDRIGESGLTFDALQQIKHKALCIGIIPFRSNQPIINPPADTPLEPDDLIIYIARNLSDCAAKADTPTSPLQTSLPRHSLPAAPRRVLVLGWSRRVPVLLHEFADDDITVDVVGLTPVAERTGNPSMKQPADVSHLEANFLDPSTLASLKPWQYDQIVLMARARMGDEAHADAATISAWLNLQSILNQRSEQPRLLVELLETENRFLFEDDEDVLVTPQVISYMLSQIALRRELAGIFAELSRVGGPQLVLRPLHSADFPKPVCFADLAAMARQQGEIALGILAADGALELNPERSAQRHIGTGDHLVALTTDPDPDTLNRQTGAT